jgi:hypothetical protein
MKSILTNNLVKHIIIAVQKPIIAIWFLLLMLFPSCLNEEICEDVSTVPVRIGFYFDDDTQAQPVLLEFDSLKVQGVGNDSIVYDYLYNVSRIELPLNSNAESSAFLIYYPAPPEIAHLVVDTIRFYYEVKPTLISMECGFVSFFELKEVRHSRMMIDSISIEETSIINNFDEHIKIFPFVDDSNL